MAPYGLRADKDRKLHHATDQRRIVTHIVSCIAEGFSQRTVAKGLNSGPNPIPGPGGGRWQANAICRILHNPVYEGRKVAPRRHKSTQGRFQASRAGEGNRVGSFAEGVEPIPHDLLTRARRWLPDSPSRRPNRPAARGRCGTPHGSGEVPGLSRGCLTGLARLPVLARRAV
ncbi:recombinase family protein [Kitasatospora griseola]|uniref:recombinase family protein n=1 Tax=Kitasatospora griseola TaxID=2064 RepID=UPI0036DBC5B7